MESERKTTVPCPKCTYLNSVTVDQESFRCIDCGAVCGIAQPLSTTDNLQVQRAMQEQLTSLRQQGQEVEKLREELFEELRRHEEQRWSLLSRVLGVVTFSPLGRHLVPYDEVRRLNEADIESSVTFSVFTLFLGLGVQQWLNEGQLTSAVVALILATVLFGGYAVYAYIKARRIKQDMHDARRTPIEVLFGVVPSNAD